jgi:enhancer of polycomb-like protein
MDEADELALKRLNNSLPPVLRPCTEDQFEQVMGFFEETAHNKQPFAMVDNANVLPLEELEEQVDESTAPVVPRLAKYIYEIWRSRRIEAANRSVQPCLKVSKICQV